VIVVVIHREGKTLVHPGDKKGVFGSLQKPESHFLIRRLAELTCFSQVAICVLVGSPLP
jgi:hypothetical protein